jgi:hypothetical protein
VNLRPKLFERVELARRPRQLVVELGQNLLLDLLDGQLDVGRLLLIDWNRDRFGLARGHADQALL